MAEIRYRIALELAYDSDDDYGSPSDWDWAELTDCADVTILDTKLVLNSRSKALKSLDDIEPKPKQGKMDAETAHKARSSGGARGLK